MASDRKEILAPFNEFLRLFDGQPLRGFREQVEEALISLCRKGRNAGKGFDPALVAKILHLIRLTVEERYVPSEMSGQKIRRMADRARSMQKRLKKLNEDVRAEANESFLGRDASRPDSCWRSVER